jgi:hypothetical protein
VNIEDWRYEDHVEEERRQQLRADGSFGALIRRVLTDLEVTTVYPLPGQDVGLTDCLQPILVLDLPSTGDALFNGPFGYRAQYWISPEVGLAANAKIIAALAPKLLSAVDPCDERLTRIDLCKSLRAASAKPAAGPFSVIAEAVGSSSE